MTNLNNFKEPMMPQSEKNSKIIGFWLFLCAFMVMAMTGIGAVTRLTESGLSIARWDVVSGTIPPLTSMDWQEQFEIYQQTPQYTQINNGMSLDEFKGIFFWEWFHRFWGRMIGIVFALPMVFFFAVGWIAKEERLKYIGLLCLGGAQGALGWFMVKSGLVDRPSVSHFRLAAHLSTALLIYSALVWTGLQNFRTKKQSISPSVRYHGLVCLALVAITIIWGAFVAGLDAGMIYNSFPMMGDGFIPQELGKAPFLSDPASVQFTHRALAMITGLSVFMYGIRWTVHTPKIGTTLCVWVMVQIGLGIATLLSVVAIPVAAMHQMGAVILLTIIIYSLYVSRPSRAMISE
jgi:cytochrome c oxidase assembly protein subunit 15